MYTKFNIFQHRLVLFGMAVEHMASSVDGRWPITQATIKAKEIKRIYHFKIEYY
jgi:hypothetical protein